MKELGILCILLIAIIFAAGCSDNSKSNSTNAPNIQKNSSTSEETQNESSVVEVTRLSQINTSLQKGPVFLKIGAEWCEECQSLKPVLSQIAAEYKGKVTIMSLDIDKSHDLANYFGVYVIPDSCVIVGSKGGKYVYMKEDGEVTTDRSKAKILKIEGKDVYENILDLALQKKNQT